MTDMYVFTKPPFIHFTVYKRFAGNNPVDCSIIQYPRKAIIYTSETKEASSTFTYVLQSIRYYNNIPINNMHNIILSLSICILLLLCIMYLHNILSVAQRRKRVSGDILGRVSDVLPLSLSLFLSLILSICLCPSLHYMYTFMIF